MFGMDLSELLFIISYAAIPAVFAITLHEVAHGWAAKTAGIAILAAVVTAVLTTLIQQLIWNQSNTGVAGGAATGVAVAIWMARRKQHPAEPPKT